MKHALDFLELTIEKIYECLVHNKNTQSCRTNSQKLQGEFPYCCITVFGIFLSPY